MSLKVIAGGRAEAERPGFPVPSISAAPRADPGLLSELYEKHAPAVFARCRYLLRDDEGAKDALQEVFVRVLKALPEFRAASSPLTWILRIATHHCLNLLRAERASWREELGRIAAARVVGREGPDRRELVRSLLASATPEAQEVAVLYYVDELTQQEIADVTHLSRPTVRKRLRQFLRSARAALAQAFPGLTLPEGDDP
jgi:RNA polymerase sigma factor (sigma-70 family)